MRHPTLQIALTAGLSAFAMTLALLSCGGSSKAQDAGYYARQTYTSTGGSTYPVPFPYIRPQDVTVTDNGNPYNGAVSFPSPAVVALSPAIPVGDTVVISRATSITSPEAVFQGGPLRTVDLNNNALQSVYATQESRDAIISAQISPLLPFVPPADTPLWQNSDMLQGNPGRVLVPNNALDAVGLMDYVAQQATLNPFMSVQRFQSPTTGAYTLRMTNGLPSFTTATIAIGTQTLNVGPGLNFAPGISVTAANANNPIADNMSGVVQSYDATGGNLVINVTSVVGSGTYSTWAIGRVGTTQQGQTFLTTSADNPSGTNVLHFASTSGVQVGAAVQVGTLPLPAAPYVVSVTPTTVTISANSTGDIPSGTPITFYGDQGVFLYENIQSENAVGFRMGTPLAQTSYLSFNVRSGWIQGQASIMFLGYSSLTTLGRSLAQLFPVTQTETRQTIKLPGDIAPPPSGTWIAGYDATNYPWAALGFAWECNNTPTCVTIPSGVWTNTLNVGGAAGQTFDLGSVVGAWVEFSEPKLEFVSPTAYVAPTYNIQPYNFFEAMAPVAPGFRFNATRNGLDLKRGQWFEDANGCFALQSLNDAETSGSQLTLTCRDGTFSAANLVAPTATITGSLFGRVGVFSTSVNTTTLGATTINFSGGINAGASAGVSCAAGTVSLTTLTITEGIITHC